MDPVGYLLTGFFYCMETVVKASNTYMLQLKSLQQQLTTLELALDDAIVNNKTFSEVKDIYMQIKDVKQLMCDRIELLKGAGLYEE